MSEYEWERREGLAAMRGLLIACFLSLGMICLSVLVWVVVW